MNQVPALLGPINRPEYPRNPEGPLSALAWSITGLSHSRQPGRVYETVLKSKRAVEETKCRPEDWVTELERAGLEFPNELSKAAVAESLLKSISGVRAEKANAIAAVPLVPNAAYLQNPVGVHSKDGPPNFALIVEQLYALGHTQPVPVHSAAAKFMQALSHSETQLVFTILNRALAKLVSDSEFSGAPPAISHGAMGTLGSPLWLARAPNPFSWFRTSWDAFCEPAWREALPRRRWSDWAACVLRTGVSLSFLWEANFYRYLGHAISSDTTHAATSLESFLKGNLPLLHWSSTSDGITVRDVNSKIIRTLVDGNNVRSFLAEVAESDSRWQKESKNWSSVDGLQRFLRWAQARLSATDITSCYGRRRNSAANNLIETVVYLLQTRQHLGLDADFYGLFNRRKRRFLIIEPGVEWIVVIASLAAQAPGRSTNLRAIKQHMRFLGISVPREVLVTELERAGLARNSHDADDAIAVQAGF